MNTNTPLSKFFENKNHEPSKPSQHHMSNNLNIDLSTSNPHSQYSVSQHGLCSDNTLTNLLMYESEYVPMNKKQVKKSQEGGNRIQQNSNEEQPTYYHDNTQDNKYQPSEQESEDLLFNFILKLMGALSFRARIVQRNVFQEIYIYSSRRVFEEHPIAMDLSDSQGEQEEHKGSAITFNQNNNKNHQQEQLPSAMFNFNSSVKRKYTSTQAISMCTARVVPSFSLAKAIKNSINLHEQNINFISVQEQVSRPITAIRKIVPDVFKEESIDELGFFDNFDPIYFENSSSDTPPSNDYEIVDYLNIGNVISSRSSGKQLEVKNSFQGHEIRYQEKKNYLQNFYQKSQPVIQQDYQMFQANHQNNQNYQLPTHRPTSFHSKPESPVPQRPISNIQSPTHYKPIQKVHSPNKEVYNEYGRPSNQPQTQFSKPTTPIPHIQNKSPQPFQKINITYNNKKQGPIPPRSQSQLPRHGSEPNLNFPRNQKINVVHSPIKPQSSNNVNVVLSQYYVTKNNPVVVKSTFNPKNFTNTNTNPSINTTPQNIHPKQMNNPISIQNASLKRINSAPSSPFHPKFVNDFSQRALNDTHRTSQDTSVKTMQNGQEKKIQPIQQIQPTKPLFPSQKNEQYINEYYEFTRPKKQQIQKEPDQSNASGTFSTKSKKGKKISVVSSSNNKK